MTASPGQLRRPNQPILRYEEVKPKASWTLGVGEGSTVIRLRNIERLEKACVLMLLMFMRSIQSFYISTVKS